jgi:aminoglycoside N3'-acetyltransferase
MTEDLRAYSIACDFCSKKKKFSNCKQVVLKIDKNNNYQFLFGMMCTSCQKNNIRKTVHGQHIKIVTSRNHHRDEKSLFDPEELEVD